MGMYFAMPSLPFIHTIEFEGIIFAAHAARIEKIVAFFHG
jgi:hypothetical protein